MARRVYKNVYHGTYWPMPEKLNDQWEPFIDLDPDRSDYGAVWFTQSEKDAEFFAAWHSSNGYPPRSKSGNDTLVMFRARLELPNARVATPRWLELKGQEIREYGDGVTDIGIMWEEARDEGKDAFIVSANYQCGGDDIAVFDLRGFSLQGIKTKLPGQDWTEYMEAEEAVRLFKQFWGWSEE